MLEFAQPGRGYPAALYRFYLTRLLPAVGDLIDGRTHSYRYLAETIVDFPEPEAFAGEMRQAGFGEVAVSQMTAGIVAFYCARAGGRPG